MWGQRNIFCQYSHPKEINRTRFLFYSEFHLHPLHLDLCSFLTFPPYPQLHSMSANLPPSPSALSSSAWLCVCHTPKESAQGIICSFPHPLTLLWRCSLLLTCYLLRALDLPSTPLGSKPPSLDILILELECCFLVNIQVLLNLLTGFKVLWSGRNLKITDSTFTTLTVNCVVYIVSSCLPPAISHYLQKYFCLSCIAIHHKIFSLFFVCIWFCLKFSRLQVLLAFASLRNLTSASLYFWSSSASALLDDLNNNDLCESKQFFSLCLVKNRLKSSIPFPLKCLGFFTC